MPRKGGHHLYRLHAAIGTGGMFVFMSGKFPHAAQLEIGNSVCTMEREKVDMIIGKKRRKMCRLLYMRVPDVQTDAVANNKFYSHALHSTLNQI